MENKCKGSGLVGGCSKSAKEFHHWLERNLFLIVQPENEHEASSL